MADAPGDAHGPAPPQPDSRAGERVAEATAPPEPKAGATPSGGAFRGVVTVNGQRIWVCPHVHFTDHSAKACAERQMRSGAR